MISGNVNLLRCPAISVALIDSSGQDRTIEAHLDTGFTGELTLPKAVIERLGLALAGRSGSYRMGSGSAAAFNTYGCRIRWHDENQAY